jgi:hypothetical protein
MGRCPMRACRPSAATTTISAVPLKEHLRASVPAQIASRATPGHRSSCCDEVNATETDLRRCAGSPRASTMPIPPAGLFVVKERTMYLRSFSAMTVAHEFAHALHCALGGGVYLSGVDPRIRRTFERATAFVTPYAASGIDEYFAEAMRAWVEANDPQSLWPRATRARLLAVDPAMTAILGSLFKHELAD